MNRATPIARISSLARSTLATLATTMLAIVALPQQLDAATPPGIERSHGHYIQNLDRHTRIDWSGGYIYSSASVDLVRIIHDRRHPDFGAPDTERNLSAARARARDEAYELAAARIMRSFARLAYDGNWTLRQRLDDDERLQQQFGRIEELLVVRNRTTGQGSITIELALPFRGDEGLQSMLARSAPARQPLAEIEPMPGLERDQITSLIIDATHLDNYNPALMPRIYSDQGRLIYGPEIAHPGCIAERGVARYYPDQERAMRDPISGRAPYYTFAAGARGRTGADIYLDSNDTLRILGTEGGRRALRHCAVIILVAPSR